MANVLRRREFFKAGTAALAATDVVVNSLASQPKEPPKSRYQADVPDTLDLAERARFAINALTGAASPEHNYEPYHCAHFWCRPAYMTLFTAGPCRPKVLQALPMMRAMSGSQQNADVDLKMLEGVLRDVDENGLWWMKAPWYVANYKEAQVWSVSQGRLIGALLDWYRYDGDSRWLKTAERVTQGTAKMAMQDEQYAWYGESRGRSGWPATVDPTNPEVDPAAWVFDNGNALYGLARWYAVSGDKHTLELARKAAAFMQKPMLWGASEGPTMVPGPERGFWEGHYHSHTRGMMGLLEYANTVHDEESQRFVAAFYEYARNFGIARMGFFPAEIWPLNKIEKKFGQFGGKGVIDEGCAVADMVWLASMLSEAGVGDYWDDVDQYVRNHIIEHQLLRRDLLEEISEAGPEHKPDPRWETVDHVIERNIGAFSSSTDPTMLYPRWTLCCNANCPGALYKAWSSSLRYADGVAQVNLLLNRASAWMDVDSYLPYEGRVVLKNKEARRAHIRLSTWIEKEKVRCLVNQKVVPTRWLSNYLLVEGLRGGDVVAILFPVKEKTEQLTEAAYGQTYTCNFKGNTLVDIAPRAERLSWRREPSDDGTVNPVNKGCPLYLRDEFKKNSAPMKKVERYISATLV